MDKTAIISLTPLDAAHHIDALQQLYRATPSYWAMYNLISSPAGQAARDINEAATTYGRYMMGVVQRLDPNDPQAGAELIGLIDFRLHWPNESTAYLGMLMIAEPYQRQGLGSQAWSLLKPWLADTAQVSKVRLGVEQFNPAALRFFQKLGFTLSGESNRIRVGDKFVRLLYMEQELQHNT